MDMLDDVGWKEEWTLGCDSIDKQHRQIIKLFNALVHAIQSPESVRLGRIRNAVSTLVIYYEIHNKSEEALMRRVNYPEDLFIAHAIGHAKVSQDIHNLIEFFDNDPDLRLNMEWLKEVVRSWTTSIPLSQDDIDLIKYIKEHKQ